MVKNLISTFFQVRDLLPFAFLHEGGQQLSIEARGIVDEHREAGGLQTTPVRSTSGAVLSTPVKIIDDNSNCFSDVSSHLDEFGRNVKK